MTAPDLVIITCACTQLVLLILSALQMSYVQCLGFFLLTLKHLQKDYTMIQIGNKKSYYRCEQLRNRLVGRAEGGCILCGKELPLEEMTKTKFFLRIQDLGKDSHHIS